MAKNVKKEEKSQNSFWGAVYDYLGNISLTWMISCTMIIFFFLFLFFIHANVISDKTFIYSKNSLVMKNEIPRWIEESGLTSKIHLNTKEVTKSYRGKSFFDEDTLGSLHTALMDTNWIKDVSLEKSFPSKIEMTINFRRPIVAFLCNENWYTLDSECYLVPVVENKGLESLDLIRFIDAPEPKETLKPGELIATESIKKAVQLSILISDRITTSGKLLRIIFVKDKDTKEYRFRLVFQNGLEVNWGTYLPDDEIDRFPGKYLNSEEKLAVLFTSLNKNPNQLHINVEFSK